MSHPRTDCRESDRCPLSGERGHPLRKRRAAELAGSYESYFGNPLPDSMRSKYFEDDVQEFYSDVSHLRWFSPALIAGEDFYQLMAETYSWYYTESTWDKHYALRTLRRLGIKRFFEVGCGDGIFLDMARRHGVTGIGVDTNRDALERSKLKGLQAIHPEDLDSHDTAVDALIMLQVLEHVPDPLGFVRQYVDRCRANCLVIAVPCHETLLSRLSDPLAWPPHHVTMWSERAFAYLGRKIGFKVSHVAYPAMTYLRLVQLFNLEPDAMTPMGPMRSRAVGSGKAHDVVARWIRKVECWDARLRREQSSDVFSKGVKTIYRHALRPFDEPREGTRIGPKFGRLKWLWHCAAGQSWARRDCWMLVVMDREP